MPDVRTDREDSLVRTGLDATDDRTPNQLPGRNGDLAMTKYE